MDVVNEQTKLGKYKKIQELGSGGFGKTYLVSKIGTREKYVMKEIKLPKVDFMVFFDEINTLKKISKYGCRKDLLCYHDYFIDYSKSMLYIVTKAFENATTLQEFLQVRQLLRAPPPRKHLLTIMYNLLEALAYLHNIGIAHSDIKPDNILINPWLEIQVIDFGLSCSERCRPGGTITFMAPEMLRKYIEGIKQVSFQTTVAADVFSMGVTFYLLANMEYPFPMYPSMKKVRGLSSLIEMFEKHYRPHTYQVDLDNEEVGIADLLTFYEKRGDKIISLYNNNATPIDKAINDIIESMLSVKTLLFRGRPSANKALSQVRKLMSRLQDAHS